jgi:hypothetical protein
MKILLIPPAGTLREPFEKNLISTVYPNLKYTFGNDVEVYVGWNSDYLKLSENTTFELKECAKPVFLRG